MTIIGALSYGELAAMMPKRRRPVCLPPRGPRPALGIPLRLDALPRHPDRHHRRGRRGVRQIPRRLLPSVSARPLALAHRPRPGIPIGPMVLGNMDIGLNTANLAAIVIITCSPCSTPSASSSARRCRMSSPPPRSSRSSPSSPSASSRRTPLPSPPTSAPAGITSGLELRLAHPARCSGRRRRPHRLRRPAHRNRRGAGRQLFSSDAWNNVTFTAGEIENPKRNLPLSLAIGTGVVLLLYIALQLRLPQRSADGRRSRTPPPSPAAASSSPRRTASPPPSWSRLRRHRRQAHGRRHPRLHLRLRQRHAASPARASTTP
jgi:APA family basic amino acid/polyamine antiporter